MVQLLHHLDEQRVALIPRLIGTRCLGVHHQPGFFLLLLALFMKHGLRMEVRPRDLGVGEYDAAARATAAFA